MVDHRQRHHKHRNHSSNTPSTSNSRNDDHNHDPTVSLPKDTHVQGMFLALAAGFLAASASLCGKFSMTSTEALLTCKSLLGFYYFEVNVDDNMNVRPNDHNFIMQQAEQLHHTCLQFLMTFRALFFVFMILCNTIMWTVFTKSLHFCKSTLEATVTNTAANFFFTAIYGQVLFREVLSVMWWSGTGLIIIGLLFINAGNNLLDKTEQNPPTTFSKKQS